MSDDKDRIEVCPECDRPVETRVGTDLADHDADWYCRKCGPVEEIELRPRKIGSNLAGTAATLAATDPEDIGL